MFKCCKKPKGKESFNIPKIETTKDNFSDFELDVLELVNYHRRKKGLQMLLFNFPLASIALSHSKYMVSVGRASHDNFPIRNAQVIKQLNTTWLGECVAYGFGTAKGVVNNWIKSEGHRKILESEKAKRFTISIIKDHKNRNYFTLLIIE